MTGSRSAFFGSDLLEWYHQLLKKDPVPGNYSVRTATDHFHTKLLRITPSELRSTHKMIALRHYHIQLHTPQSAGLVLSRNRPVEKTSTWQNTTPTTERHPCPRRDSNTQTQRSVADLSRRPLGHWHRLLSLNKFKIITSACVATYTLHIPPIIISNLQTSIC